jgi:hypothetical protein
MVKHVTLWLDAYLDGELSGAQLRRVEDHLSGCDECRVKLEQTRNLSTLLRESAPVDEFLPSERFVSNLNLLLPRQPVQTRSHKVLEIGWWLIPIGALTIWLFFLITFSISSVLSTASEAGLFGNGFSLRGGSPQTEWFSMAMNLSGGQIGSMGRSTLSMLNDLNIFMQDMMSSLIWQAFLAMLYLGWLASWWQR